MTTPGFNQPAYLVGQFGTPLWGVSGSPKPFTGNYFWVDETNGSDGNTGGPSDPLATLSQAHTMCTANNNDVVFLTGTVHVTAKLTWSKSRTHLIGLSPTLSINARSRISSTGANTYTPMVSVTAAECIFENIGAFSGISAASNICWADSGGRNHYKNCAILGMAGASAASSAASRSLTIETAGENYFEECQIGLDTITRSAANASVEFLSGTPRNVFRRCTFPILTSDATAVIATVGAAGMDRFAYFDECTFINAVESTSTTMNAAFTANAAAGGAILLRNPVSLGITAIATTGPVYLVGNIPVATTSGIAIKAT